MRYSICVCIPTLDKRKGRLRALCRVARRDVIGISRQHEQLRMRKDVSNA